MTMNYDGYLIRKFGRQYAVYDWDWETEILVYIALSLNAARAWIDGRNA